MSHYNVLAIVRKNSTRSLEDIMGPYDEDLEVTPYIYQTKEDVIKEFTERVKRYRRSYKRALELSETEYLEVRDKEDLATCSYRDLREGLPEGYADVNVDDPEAVYALFREENGEGEEFDEEGNLLTSYNPNSRWDWYVIGGRWSDELILKNGKKTDEAEAGEVDWDAMFKSDPKATERLGEFWEEYVLGNLPSEVAELDEKGKNEYLVKKYGWTRYRPEYFLEYYGTKEEYIRRIQLWITHAVVDENGWHEIGKMGWFGCSSETPDDDKNWADHYRARFIDTLDPEDVVVIVDCHI